LIIRLVYPSMGYSQTRVTRCTGSRGLLLQVAKSLPICVVTSKPGLRTPVPFLSGIGQTAPGSQWTPLPPSGRESARQRTAPVQVLRFIRSETLFADALALRGQRSMLWMVFFVYAFSGWDRKGDQVLSRSRIEALCRARCNTGGRVRPVCPDTAMTWLAGDVIDEQRLPPSRPRGGPSRCLGRKGLERFVRHAPASCSNRNWRESRHHRGAEQIVTARAGLARKRAASGLFARRNALLRSNREHRRSTGPEHGFGRSAHSSRISSPRSRLCMGAFSRVSSCALAFFESGQDIPSLDYSIRRRRKTCFGASRNLNIVRCVRLPFLDAQTHRRGTRQSRVIRFMPSNGSRRADQHPSALKRYSELAQKAARITRTSLNGRLQAVNKLEQPPKVM